MLAIGCRGGAIPANQLRCLFSLKKRVFGSRSNQDAKRRQNALKKSYQTLGVSEDCQDETLRLAFIHMAKQFHPDGGSRDADATTFSEIENAYRIIQKERCIQREKEAISAPRVEEFDIKHTAPQHRHFLEYDTGAGSPSVRQRRHAAYRAQKAAENVMEHRLEKLEADERNTLVGMDKGRAKDIKTRHGIDRLVEDLIQEAINKGEFSHLPGSGKPLKDNSTSQNPYVDFVTHKLNQVLIDNGFTPEWIQLSKEIREETRKIEDGLARARNKLGCLPLSPEDSRSWRETLTRMTELVKRINSQIDKYNLLVPILQKQMLQIDLEVLAKRALEQPPLVQDNSIKGQIIKDTISSDQPSFLELLLYGFNNTKEK